MYNKVENKGKFMGCECKDKINERVFKVTGCRNVDELLDKLEEMQEAYLLDATDFDEDDEEYTVPLLTQIENRLDLLEQEQNKIFQNNRVVDKMVSVQEVEDAELYINNGKIIKDRYHSIYGVPQESDTDYKRVIISALTQDGTVRVYKLWEKE